MRAISVAFAIVSAMLGASAAHAREADTLQAQCLAIAHAQHGATPGSTHKQLGPHRFRMRELCAAWSALAASTAGDKIKAATVLAQRCEREARFDLSRANEIAFERHVKSGIEMCRSYRLQAAKTT